MKAEEEILSKKQFYFIVVVNKKEMIKDVNFIQKKKYSIKKT